MGTCIIHWEHGRQLNSQLFISNWHQVSPALLTLHTLVPSSVTKRPYCASEILCDSIWGYKRVYVCMWVCAKSGLWKRLRKHSGKVFLGSLPHSQVKIDIVAPLGDEIFVKCPTLSSVRQPQAACDNVEEITKTWAGWVSAELGVKCGV